jgi:heptosyltransferase III
VVGSVLECLPQGSRVAVVRLRSLGDCVLTTPALDILKRSRPDVRVAVVVDDRFRTLFENNPDVDQILPPELAALRQWNAQLCINFHGGNRSALLTALSGAGQRAGFGHYRHQWIYNLRMPRAQEVLGEERTVHTAEHLASAMFWLGAQRCDIPRAKLAASGQDSAAVQTRWADRRQGIAVIHAVAATPEKTWHAEGFLAVARRLREFGLEPVFIGTKTDNLSAFDGHRTMAGAPLAEVKALLAQASFFVGNDSGPAHMAAAFGLPVVVIFGASNAAIWGPWRTPSEIVTAPGGIAEVHTADVLAAMERLRVHA